VLDEPLPVVELVEPDEPEGVVLPCVEVVLDALLPLPSELPLLPWLALLPASLCCCVS